MASTAKKLENHKRPTRNGSFVWFEIHTPNPDAARAFFCELIGYKTQTMPMGEGSYTMLAVGEETVAGIMPLEKGPARFVSYVSVNDVDDAAKRVKKAGGKTQEAFEVPTIGRMQGVNDPDGAEFFVSTLGNGDPAPVKGQGAFIWNELWAADDVKSLAFATSVLGYVADTMDFGGAPYHVLKTKEGPQAGIMKSPVPGLAPHWLPYIEVKNVDETLKRAKKLGATVEGEAMDAPGIGRFATLRSPDGARFAVMTPAAK